MLTAGTVRAGDDLREMSRVTPEKIVAAVEQIVAKAKPLKVIAFGSRARGDHRPDSDLDLAVIMERYDVKMNPWPISRTEVNAHFAMDLLFFDQARYEFMTGSIISVENRIAEEGMTLYDSTVGTIDRVAAAHLAQG